MVGETIWDIVSKCQTLPKGNEAFSIGFTEERISGYGYCFATLMRQLSLPYKVITKVGSGIYGQNICNQLQKEKISFLQSKGTHGSTYTLIDAQGSYNTFSVVGEERQLSFRELSDDSFLEGMKILFSLSFLNEENINEGLSFFSKHSEQIVLLVSDSFAQADFYFQDQLFALHLPMILSDRQGLLILRKENKIAKEVILRELFNKNQAPVVLSFSDFSSGYIDQQQMGLSDAAKAGTIDLSRKDIFHAIGYGLAMAVGLNAIASLHFADFLSLIVSKKETLTFTKEEIQQIKQELVNGL